MTRFKLLFLVSVLLAAGAAPAQAGFVTIGSDLTAPATLAQSHPRDWAAWPTGFGAGGGGFVAPVQGEVALAKLKGRIIQSPQSPNRIPPVVMHVVVLRPQAGGGEMLTVSTEDLPLPTSGDPQQVNVHNLQARPARICVQPGDHVALATSGGFGNRPEGGFPEGSYADGVAFQMFGRGPGSSIALFEQPPDGSFQVGDVERGVPGPGIELLMQAVIGTAGDAHYFCRTAAEKAQNLPDPSENPPTSTGPGQVIQNGAPSLPATKKTVKIRKGVVKLAVACSAVGPCPGGTLALSNNKVVYAKAAFALAPGATQVLSLKFDQTGLKRLKMGRGKVTVKATATTRDGTATRRLLVKR